MYFVLKLINHIHDGIWKCYNTFTILPFDHCRFGQTTLLNNKHINLQILNRTNNIFELVTVEPVHERSDGNGHRSSELLSDTDTIAEEDKNLRLKGKMRRKTSFIDRTTHELGLDDEIM